MGFEDGAWGQPAQGADAVTVTLTHPYLVQQHELTLADWQSSGLLHEQGSFPGGYSDCTAPQCPVGNVSWYDALVFANVYSAKQSLPPCYRLVDCTGDAGVGLDCGDAQLTAATSYDCDGYRLPTEAEWEYATRAGSTTDFYDGNREDPTLQNVPDPVLDRIAWYSMNANRATHPVGLKKPNGWGLYDTTGNCDEWVFDEISVTGYEPGPLVDPVGRQGFYERATRGGEPWAESFAYASAWRSSSVPKAHGAGLGFRLARTLR